MDDQRLKRVTELVKSLNALVYGYQAADVITAMTVVLGSILKNNCPDSHAGLEVVYDQLLDRIDDDTDDAGN